MTHHDNQSIIERAAKTGLGQVTDLHTEIDDDAFGWTRSITATGVDIRDSNIEVAMPRDGSPQGTEFVLIRDTADPGKVFAFKRDRWMQLVTAIRDGHYTLS